MGLDIWALLLSILALVVAGAAFKNGHKDRRNTEPPPGAPALSDSTQRKLAELTNRATITLLKLNMLGEQNTFRAQVMPHLFQLIDQLDKMDTLIKQDTTDLGEDFFQQKFNELQEVEGAFNSLSARIAIEMGQQPT